MQHSRATDVFENVMKGDNSSFDYDTVKLLNLILIMINFVILCCCIHNIINS